MLFASDGRSRKMAFIGFRSIESATIALKHFNKTFIDTCKIDVEFAVNPRDAKEAVQAWSRHTEGSSRWKDQHQPPKETIPTETTPSSSSKQTDPSMIARSKASKSSAFSQSAFYGLSSNTNLSKLMEDSKFQEYLHVMQSRSKNKFWSNTTMEDGSMNGATTEADLKSVRGDASYQTYEDYLKEQGLPGHEEDGEEGEEDDDEYFNQPMLERNDEEMNKLEKIPNINTDGSEKKMKKAKKEHSDSDSDSDDADVTLSNPLLLNQDVSDLDYLKSKQSGMKDFDDDSDMEDAPTNTTPTTTTTKEKKSSKRKATNEAPAHDDDDDDDEKKVVVDDETGAGDADDDALKAAYEADLAAERAAAESKTAADELMETGRLFLRNLSYSVTESDLRTLFSPFGTISEIHLPIDEFGKSKGFAYVSFMFPAHALAAQRTLDGEFFLGRLLHILNGRPKPEKKSEWEKLQEMGDDALKNVTYKKKKELEMQAKAGTKKDQQSWNMLFLRSDTVTDAIATKYGINKSDILDTTNDVSSSSSTGMAVRLALAESTLISETKSFLSSHGVDIQVFDQPKSETQRSKTCLLIKNLPPNTELDELRRLFGKHGSLGHVVMPPSKTICLLEFIEERDALKAFKALAYKKFKFVPLYLEWAPKGTFGLDGDSSNTTTKVGGSGVVEGKKSMVDDVDENEERHGKSSSESCTIYVKNLNFDTTNESLKTLFTTIGPLRSCTIQTKKNTRQRPGMNDPSVLSMGYGFVEFRSSNDATKALQQLQGIQLDNHALELKLSSRGTTSSTASTAKPRTPSAVAHVAASAASGSTSSTGSAAPSSKLLVKNVPFETTARELRELFSAFGTIQRIRLPKKFGQLGHRGFAFIDFGSKAEAKNAMENVKHSHLYGRHLVIEYAAASIEQDSQDVEGLRKKTQEQFATQQGGAPPHKKRRVDADEDEIDQAFEKQFK